MEQNIKKKSYYSLEYANYINQKTLAINSRKLRLDKIRELHGANHSSHSNTPTKSRHKILA